MVVALGPGKFYGSSLPRPRFYTDVKLNPERVDPPPLVLDPLMSWAMDAHWSMGGLSFKRHRLQGRIEGKVERLRTQREQISKKSAGDSPAVKSGKKGGTSRVRNSPSPSPPPPPVALKRRRVVGLIDEEDDEEVDVPPAKRGPVRKLGDDFERVARESGIGAASGGEAGGAVAGRTRSKRVEVGAGAVERKTKKKKKLVKGVRRIGAAVATGKRSSPRLAKSGGSL
ncbi:sister chromatid cohesion protein PDS5 homolog B [Striga asiatica]|uniref:Sister chromatid cohesion protein PDS5 homolog B n=1 Tax=Striga asiatica TaxID=4170 RepID=A0A5A7RAD1_STRAF|nr:sister chromatid cohesion protein PDS5 homolog B [Striga asiatica]